MEFPKKKLKKVEKKGLELLRRWRVKILNIEIEALEETFDPFLQFVVGGTFQKEFLTRPDGRKTFRIDGKKGKIFKTNVLLDINKGESASYYRYLNCEVFMSYSQIMQERLHIEVNLSILQILYLFMK